MTATLPTSSPTAAGDPVRVAVRHRRPGWRDPRILIGVLIVAASVLAGVKILAAADDTVTVWGLARSMPAGTRITTDDVVPVRVRFTASDQADRYLPTGAALPRGAVLSRDVDAGELLPRAALADSGAALVEVPLSVAVDDVPATVAQGSVVDVWVAPQGATTATQVPRAVRVLDDVVVVRVPAIRDSLAPTGSRQVIVGVDADEADKLGPALGRTSAGRVFLTRQQG